MDDTNTYTNQNEGQDENQTIKAGLDGYTQGARPGEGPEGVEIPAAGGAETDAGQSSGSNGKEYRTGSNQAGQQQNYSCQDAAWTGGSYQERSYQQGNYQNVPGACSAGDYQNNAYQNNGYQGSAYQNNGYQGSGYQNNGYQNGAYQDYSGQNGAYQGVSYQNGSYQNGAFSGSGYQDPGNGYQPYSGMQPYPNGQMELEEPVKVGEWVLSLLLMMIPCVNIIMMFVWAFSSTEKKSKSNFFKAYLIFFGISIGLMMLIWIAVVVFALMLG